MKIHKGTTKTRISNPVVSIGVFDGVHRGHVAIFDRVKERAAAMDGESVIVTFHPHPRLVLGKDSGRLRYLTTLAEKKELIGSHGINHLVVISFTKEFATLPPCRFVKEYLVERTGLRHLVFGYDHHFGHKREGNYNSLTSCGRLYGFSLEQLEPVRDSDARISSSAIRDAIQVGDVKLAAKLLSYDYQVHGSVTGGLQVGRSIGYPTANLQPDDEHKMIPGDGVYAVRVELGGELHRGMMNIGYRPTINRQKRERTLEVHIMDFEGNLYNRRLGVSFVERIREEKRFGSLEELQKQLARDRQKALAIL